MDENHRLTLDRIALTDEQAEQRGGGRSAFSKLESKLAKKKTKGGKKAIKNPGGLAYKIGVDKIGKAAMEAKAKAGKAKAAGK